MVDAMTFALEQVKAGTVRALAVSRKEPYAELKKAFLWHLKSCPV